MLRHPLTTKKCTVSTLSAREAVPLISHKSCHQRTHSNWCQTGLSNNKFSGSNNTNNKIRVRTSQAEIKTTVSCSNSRTTTKINYLSRGAQARSRSLDQMLVDLTKPVGASLTAVAETSRKSPLAMLISKVARQHQLYLRVSCWRVRRISSQARFS